jgi:hypothetical protein
VTVVRAALGHIVNDAALRRYGAALALSNTLTAVYWLEGQRFAKFVDARSVPVCWPFLNACAEWRFSDPLAVIGSLVLLFALGILGAVLFLRPATASVGYWTLAVTTAFKTFLLLHDYRLIMNQHYMATAAVLVFLVWPAAKQALPYLIASFYFWAGLLKLNPEWFSGAALYGRHPLGMPASLIPWACAYVVFLELIVVWGLVSKRRWFFWGAFAQVILFHISSFWVVGYFYPLLMFLILTIFPLTRLSAAPQVKTIARSTVVLLLGFSLLQIVPRLIPGDESVTGEGRMLALNMFDAPLECTATLARRVNDQVQAPRRFRPPFLQPRIECDPIVYVQFARSLCRVDRSIRGFDDVDLVLSTRKRGAPEAVEVLDIRAFCQAPPNYSAWRRNDWISIR